MEENKKEQNLEDVANTEPNLETNEVIVEDNLVNEESKQISFESKIQELEKKLAEYKDNYLRTHADMQNQQKRAQDDVKKSRDYAITNFAKDIIVVKDYLEMALKDQSGNIDAIKIGVDLTLKQLIQIFENQKIKEILPNKGDKLDPNLHQAINTVEVEGQDSNTVVDIMQKGYLLNDRVLRPAMVSVAK
jgi:molecular chaperone GrpE